jgi:predicted HTH transcriptional regulator
LGAAEAILAADDRELLLRAAAHRPLSTNWVVEALAIGTAEARAMLNALVEEGALRRTGQTRGTRYVLPGWDEVERPADPGRQRRYVVGPHQRSIVISVAHRRRITNETVRTLLHVESGQAVEVLNALVTENLLMREGVGRGTSYVPVDRVAEERPRTDCESGRAGSVMVGW